MSRKNRAYRKNSQQRANALAQDKEMQDRINQNKYCNQMDNILPYLALPKEMANPLNALSIEDVKEKYALPITNGTTQENRDALNMAFDHVGGYDMIYNSLIAHTAQMGQMPLTSFLGYGMLQQIAQNGMIRACIQTIADDLTRKWIEVKSLNDGLNERVAKIKELIETKYCLQKTFHDAITTVGYMGGAFIFIDTGVEGEDLELPLRINAQSAELTKGSKVKFIIIDPVNVSPFEYNCTNPLRDDYMKPKFWWVLGQKVHSSRLIPLIEQEPPTLLKPSYNFLGIPRAQILWDYILHWNECRVYTADLLKKISLLVVKTNTDQIFSTEGGIRAFDIKMTALQRYRDNNSVFVCDKELEDVTNIQTSIAGSTDIVRQCLEMIASINRTPAVKLLGISPSGFNATGESDLKNYYDHIRSQQELYRDAILKCIKVIQLVHFGEISKEIFFEFVELAEDNAASVAMTASTKVNTWVALNGAGVVTPDEIRQAVQSDNDIGMSFIEGDAPDIQGQEDGGMEGMGGLEDMSGMMGGMQPNEDPQAPAPKDDISKYNLGSNDNEENQA